MTRRLLACVWALATAALLARPAFSQPSIVVRGDDTCPSADAIRAALQAIRPDGEWPLQTVVVEVAAGHLSVMLGDGTGTRRELPADSDCPTRAEIVALIVTTWSGGLPSQPTASPVLTVPRPAPAPAVATAPAPPPPTPSPNVIEVDGAAFYSPVWGHAPGAWLTVGRTPRNGGVGARVLGAYQAARDVTLEAGTNQVQGLIAGAAATYHLQRPRVFASGDAGLVATLTRAQGAGYDPDRSASTTNFGGVAAVRAGLRLGQLRLWAGACLMRLVHEETVKIQSSSPGVADRAVLAAWDVQLGVGLGLRFE